MISVSFAFFFYTMTPWRNCVRNAMDLKELWCSMYKMDCVYVIQHIDSDNIIDNFRVFKSFDKAVEVLKEWLMEDMDLINYSLTSLVYDEHEEEYILHHDYDLSTIIDIDEFDELSLIDSEAEEDEDDDDEEAKNNESE